MYERLVSPGIEETERYALYKEVLKTGKPKTIDEVRLHPSLGSYVSRINIFKIGEYLGLTAINITDLKVALDELETYTYKSSHDMRAPISSILGLINVAQSGVKDLESAQYYLKLIRGQAESLNTILSKLVETNQLRKSGKSIQIINFEQITDHILKLLAYLKGFNELKIEQQISVNKQFYSDSSLVFSILQNLIDNSIKYKKENSNDAEINISIVDVNGRVSITVADNGIGIPANLQKDIYKMFFRATNQQSGSSLG